MVVTWGSLTSEISGIRPIAHLILGPGFVREEWKSLVFTDGKTVSQNAIQSLNQFAQSLVPECKGRVLDRSGRVEIIRQSFKDENLRAAVPTLSAHRYRPKFFDSLDRALQKGRLFFAHQAEAKVLEERLEERLGHEMRREEFFLLNRYWESLLQARDFFDESRVLERASEKIDLSQVKFDVKKVFRVEHFPVSPRISFFWESVARAIQVDSVHSSEFQTNEGLPPMKRKQTHSLEDAVQFLLDEIISSGDLEGSAVVIEDRPEIRRTLRRVSFERGIPLMDPRDPTFLSTSEEMKTSLLPLEIVARNYPSQLVLPWLATRFTDVGPYRKKIIEQGNVSGLDHYKVIPEVHTVLEKLKNHYLVRCDFNQFVDAVQSTVNSQALPSWVSQTYERIFSLWRLSLEQLKTSTLKKPIRIWLDELQEKIKSTPPILGPERNSSGLKLYRVDQAASLELKAIPNLNLHFLGIGASFFEPRENATEWFSVRDCEVLAHEFKISGRQSMADQAKRSFHSWLAQSKNSSTLWEYIYDEGGGETESLDLSLQSIPEIELSDKELLPVHARVLPSLGSKLSKPQGFSDIPLAQSEFPMSFLNALGNCAFTAFAQHLLKVYDERDPDFDLSGDSFGNLVHSAVESLVASNLTLSPESAFQTAWLKTAKPAWIRSERLQHAIRFKTISILHSFLESEQVYREQSQATLIGQEIKIELKRGGVTFHGRLDRIDQHADGIVLFDYKTGSSLPSGTLTLEKGKGLQLPAYALALEDAHAQAVVGAQYIQLLPRKTQRNSGFLFSRWNKGKKADVVEFPLSTATARSGSLIQAEPDVVWKKLDQKIGDLIALAKAGRFDPTPADPKDCERCRYGIICGKIRGLGEVVDPGDT